MRSSRTRSLQAPRHCTSPRHAAELSPAALFLLHYLLRSRRLPLWPSGCFELLSSRLLCLRTVSNAPGLGPTRKSRVKPPHSALCHENTQLTKAKRVANALARTARRKAPGSCSLPVAAPVLLRLTEFCLHDPASVAATHYSSFPCLQPSRQEGQIHRRRQPCGYLLCSLSPLGASATSLAFSTSASSLRARFFSSGFQPGTCGQSIE